MKNTPLSESPHSKEQDPESSWSALATMVVGLAYFLIARLNIELTAPDSGVSPAYVPAGLAVALTILYGRVTWQGNGLGAIFVTRHYQRSSRLHGSPLRWDQENTF